VATFNVYGSDHARLQGVATPAYLHRHGNATRLVKQLELLLADAGVQQLAVILEPQVGVVAAELHSWLGVYMHDGLCTCKLCRQVRQRMLQ
jgi:hypothetical protein